MSYNDQDNHHLLIWLNRQRFLIGEKHRIYSFDQLRTSRLIPVLLLKINSHFFSDIYDGDFDYKQYLLKIERYLNQVEDLKFKRSRKHELMDLQYISEMVKLILFLIMRDEIKQEFVNRILELEDETQMYLMHQIKKVEGWLENKMEIKEVLQTIESLQQENEALHQKLREVQSRNKQVLELKTQLQQQNSKITEVHRVNNAQKNRFMEDFGITHPKEYLSIYKDLIQERNDIIGQHAESQLIVAKISEDNKEMQEKIAEDALIIDHLGEQIAKYRQIYCHLRKSTLSQNDKATMEKENQEKQCSITFESTRMIKSVVRDQDHTSSCQVPVIRQFQDDQNQNGLIQSYQEDLMAKLQQMYIKIGALNGQISTLKTENQKIITNNKRKQRIIRQARDQYEQFSRGYKLTIT